MTGNIAAGFSPSQLPIRHQPTNYHDLDAHPPRRGPTDMSLPAPAIPHSEVPTPSMPTPVRAVHDGHGHGFYGHLFDNVGSLGSHTEPFPLLNESPLDCPGIAQGIS
ncbi:unnamed protein product [Parascedosporium putredinis]|uniref:Uncharacterized protein n=1 Tax=Parascedosporium putredinis TaxID=1442378 RepID=A0A9P1MDF2_9PEZI|nr:unnamed protein product [Parascedosporium putredinis]CAI7999532.1 unnamed protein product [Parascedosporium putredinis]